jgi:two-component system sensor histidine kinase/response regulator
MKSFLNWKKVRIINKGFVMDIIKNTEDNAPFILVVDDILRNLQVIGNILEEEGYEISVATNGEEALEIVHEETPDLILLDVMMPGMNGFEVCRRLKGMEKVKEIPVIFLTAKTETEDIIKGFEIGGIDYISKPFKKEELLIRIKTHLQLKFSKEIIVNKNIRLEQLNKEKNEFLGIAAHDLKNPLSTIKGYAELMEIDAANMSSDEIIEFAGQIKSMSQYMFQIIIDLLDMNAIEEGKMKMNPVDFEVVTVVMNGLSKFTAPSQKKNINIKFEPESYSLSAFADVGRTQQVLDNLVSNALKFSPFDKNIYVKTYPFDMERICIEVKDEGPGISEEDQKMLFGKFTKLSARPTGNENSTGLGLSIVKKIVENMSGMIWCESTLGEGASFKFTLPSSK